MSLKQLILATGGGFSNRGFTLGIDPAGIQALAQRGKLPGLANRATVGGRAIASRSSRLPPHAPAQRVERAGTAAERVAAFERLRRVRKLTTLNT